jgi:APA family basic amino acid/polyamine antiporter
MVPANHYPLLIPATEPGHEAFNHHGWGGVLGGAGIVFFAFIGFDAVSTAWVLTGVSNWREFGTVGKEASVAYAIEHGMPGFDWLAKGVTVAILFGFSSVMLVMLLGQSRVFFTMSEDGLLPKLFSDVHPKFRTPYKCNILLFFFVGAFGAFLPESLAGDLTSIGTLFAFILVCIGVIMMRKIQPNVKRPFRTPLVPLVPILGVLVCGSMIWNLDTRTQVTALCWMLLGFVIYFLYGQSHSKLNRT